MIENLRAEMPWRDTVKEREAVPVDEPAWVALLMVMSWTGQSAKVKTQPCQGSPTKMWKMRISDVKVSLVWVYNTPLVITMACILARIPLLVRDHQQVGSTRLM